MPKKCSTVSSEELAMLIKHAIGGSDEDSASIVLPEANETEVIKSERKVTTFHQLDSANDSWMVAFQTDYLFYTTDLLGTVALVQFSFKELVAHTSSMVKLKGDVTFNTEKQIGCVMIDMNSHEVYYKHKGNRHKYWLQIDTSNESQWNELISHLQKLWFNR